MIARVLVNDQNRESVLNFIKINHPNYVLIDNYEVIDRDNTHYSDRAALTKGIQGPAVLIQMEGDVTIKIKKDDYVKKGDKLIPMFLTESDFVDVYPAYNEFLKEFKNIAPAEKVQSFKNFEIRNGQVITREHNIRGGETIFVVR